MLKARTIIFTLSLIVPLMAFTQTNISKNQLKIDTLKVVILNSNKLTLNNTYFQTMGLSKQAILFGLSQIDVPRENTETQSLTLLKKEPLSPLWNSQGQAQNFESKFKDTMYGVANGKFFTVNANQLGSSWLQQDAQQAHQKNGYRE